ncbi:PAS and PAS 11 domain containing protein [Trichuris trichiura]|uniref:PAS and PAS 11 domain containing protein n=1 Tax=Trichuris trichiura TaxID=36087 RepID=A0A077Z9V9_TRITR|nr:PAS and PAS 11 domain containing protein [Trichuris trichiura]
MYANRKRHRNFKRIRAENASQAIGSNPSKRHRERLNSELEALAFLLPFDGSIISRLDKLSILRLAVCFLQAKNVFQRKSNANDSIGAGMPYYITKEHLQYLYFPEYPFISDKKFESEEALMTALSGFLLMLNMNGEVLYISENVSTYLGFHQCDVLHQSVFDVVHSEDMELIRQLLQPTGSCVTAVGSLNPAKGCADRWLPIHRQTAVRFRCFMDNTCGFLRFDVRGKLIKLEGSLPFSLCQVSASSRANLAMPVAYGFLAACVPVVVPSHVDLSIEESFLKSKHSLQLVICSGDEGFVSLLGLKESLLPVSFYSFIHELDLPFIADAHRQVLASGTSGVLIYRLRSRNSNITYWLQTSCRLTAKNGKPEFITCTHRLLTEFEGAMLLDMRDATELQCRNSLENGSYYDGGMPVGSESLITHDQCAVEQSLTGSRLKGPWRVPAIDSYGYIHKNDSELQDNGCRTSCDFSTSLRHLAQSPAGRLNGYGSIIDSPALAYRTVQNSPYPSCSESPW